LADATFPTAKSIPGQPQPHFACKSRHSCGKGEKTNSGNPLALGTVVKVWQEPKAPGESSCTGVGDGSTFSAELWRDEVKKIGNSPMKLAGSNSSRSEIRLQERSMSTSGISSVNSSLLGPQPVPTRLREDIAGRQLEQAVQSGDLAGAQQAYKALAAFGPNNSGPFVDPSLKSQFAAIGQALQAGDIGTAQHETAALGTNLLKRDVQLAEQGYKTGGPAGAQQAIANLEGDYGQ
jgi:hypothetical protein